MFTALLPPVARTSERSSPDQRLRIGTRSFLLETERGGDGKKPYFYESAIETLLGKKVLSIVRDDNSSTVSPLHNDDGTVRQPRRYARTKKVLEVILGERMIPNSSASSSAPPILSQVDKLYCRLCLARRQGDYAVEEHCRRALHDRLPALKKCGDDDTNVAANKVDQLLRYPFPRQFFVVHDSRTPARRNNNLQLHLFCECGDILGETEPFPSSLSEPAFQAIDRPFSLKEPRLHQTAHPGYKVTDPKQLCQDFCGYILPVLKHIQSGAIKAGVIIPPLLPRWIPGSRNLGNQSQRDPWKDTMRYVVGVCNSISSTMELKELFDDEDDEEGPKPLDGPDYKLFQDILQELDSDGHFGGLIPVFSSRTGNLKWACSDHDETSACDRQNLDKFEEFTKGMEGVHLNRLKGELRFKILADSMAMKQFYKTLSTAPRFKKVAAQLTPTTTIDEYRLLKGTLSDANIAHITLNAAAEVSYNASWCNLILELMANKRCQHLHLTGIKDFLDKITGISKGASMQLQSLELDCAFLIDKHLPKLKIVMNLCPALKMLSLKSSYNEQLVSAVRTSLLKLEYLELVSQDYTTMYWIQQDKYDAMITVKTSATRLSSLDRSMYPTLKVLSFNCLDDPTGHLKGSLDHLLRNCSRLSGFDVQLPLEHFCSLVNLFQEMLRSLDPSNSAPDLKRFLRMRSLVDTDHNVEMVVHWVGHIIGTDTSIIVKMKGPKISNRHLSRIFREYRSYIKVLIANHTLDDNLVKDLSASQRGGSKMDSLIIDPSGLPDAGYVETLLQCCIPREVTLSFSCLEQRDHRQRMQAVLRLVGRQVTQLILHGRGPSEWFVGLDLSRSGLEEVRQLEIAFESGVRLDDRSARQLAALIRTPEVSRPRNTSTRTIPPLKSFSLVGCKLKTEDWATVLSNLDLKAMQRLSFEGTNFGTQEFILLIEQLKKLYTGAKRTCVLEEICVKNTDLVSAERELLDQLETRLLVQAPTIRVVR